MREASENQAEFAGNCLNNPDDLEAGLMAEWEQRRLERTATPGPVQEVSALRVDPFRRFAQLEDLLRADQIGTYREIVRELRQFAEERLALADQLSARTEWDFGATVRLRLRVWIAIQQIEWAPLARRGGISSKAWIRAAAAALESIPAETPIPQTAS